MPRRFFDVSMPLVTDMQRASAYPPPSFTPHTIGTQPDDKTVTATHIDMFAHVGTHIESPKHVLPHGPALNAYPLESFSATCYVVAIRPARSREIGVDDLSGALPDLPPNCYVFLHLSADIQDSAAPHPFLSPEAAHWLVDHQVRALGVDTSTPDKHVRERLHPLDLPVHRILCGAGILIIENLHSLKSHCDGIYGVYAWPLNIVGSDSSPVRVVLQQDR